MRAALDALSSRSAAVGPSEEGLPVDDDSDPLSDGAGDIDDLPAAEDEDEDDASSRRVVDLSLIHI